MGNFVLEIVLEKYLKSGDFYRADLETSRLLGIAIRAQVDKKYYAGASIVDIFLRVIVSQALLENGLPCSELREIDKLWLSHSNQRYGFLIQARKVLSIAKSLESTEKSPENSSTSIDQLAWNDYQAEILLSWTTSKYQINIFMGRGYINQVNSNPPEGFYPTPFWFYENTTGKFHYRIHRSIKDIAQCYSTEISSDLKKVDSVEKSPEDGLTIW